MATTEVAAVGSLSKGRDGLLEPGGKVAVVIHSCFGVFGRR